MELTRALPQAATKQQIIPVWSFVACAILLFIASRLPAGEPVETTPEMSAEDRRQGAEDAMWMAMGAMQ
jgi:hypothetical protein